MADNNIEEYPSLSMLDLGKKQKFRSPLSDNLVRIGTVGEGSCFFHSVLTSINPDNYVNMDEDEKREYVIKLREKLSDSLDIQEWENRLKQGSKILFLENLRRILETFIKLIRTFKPNIRLNNKDPMLKSIYENFFIPDSLSIYSEILKHVSFNEIDNLLPETMGNGQYSIETMINRFVKLSTSLLANKISINRVTQPIDNQLTRILIDTFSNSMRTIGNSAYEISYQKFKEKLKSCSAWVDVYLLGIIMDYFNMNTYVINDSTRMPYSLSDCSNYKDRLSVIVLWVGESHYESVGIISEDGKKVSKKVFEFDDPIIQTIHTYLCNKTSN